MSIPYLVVHLQVMHLKSICKSMRMKPTRKSMRMSMNTTKVKHFSVLLEAFRKFLRVLLFLPLEL
jgi:hypothetical protein